MAHSIKTLILSLSLAGTILLAGCSAPLSNTTPPALQTPVQAATPPAPVQDPAEATVTADNVTPVATQPQSPLPNRVDVIYFHVNQRCPTCLCFEQEVNRVMAGNFNDAINSGKLTYRVLNAQKQENFELAKKYGVVGSQLFINRVINGQDNIKDIPEIWNWNCRNDAAVFDRKVRMAIDDSLKGIP